MNKQSLQEAFSRITIWKKGEQRAPHKPLLLLYVLSEYKKGHQRFFDFGSEIQGPLLELLNSFGPSRRSHYPAMPFWRLQRDGFWSLKNAERCSPRIGSKEPPKRELIDFGVAGGFDEAAYQLLKDKPKLLDKLAQYLLEAHFPESVQDIIANQLGFSLTEVRKERDPKFRQSVLRAYNYQCAVCGYNLKHDCIPVGLEAAHIKWKQSGGPCSVNNGLALCSLHHAAFDMGAIAIDEHMKLLVSQGVNGNNIVERLFWDFAGKEIELPKNKGDYPQDSFIYWHHREVFRG